MSCRRDGSLPLAAEPRRAQRLVRIPRLSRRTHAPQPPVLCRRAWTPGRRLSGRRRCVDSRWDLPSRTGAAVVLAGGTEADRSAMWPYAELHRRARDGPRSACKAAGPRKDRSTLPGSSTADTWLPPPPAARVSALVEQTLAAPAARPARSEARAEPARAVSRRSLR